MLTYCPISHIQILHIFKESVKILGIIFSKFLLVTFLSLSSSIIYFPFYGSIIITPFIEKNKNRVHLSSKPWYFRGSPITFPQSECGVFGGGGQPEVWSCFEFGLLPMRHNETLGTQVSIHLWIQIMATCKLVVTWMKWGDWHGFNQHKIWG